MLTWSIRFTKGAYYVLTLPKLGSEMLASTLYYQAGILLGGKGGCIFKPELFQNVADFRTVTKKINREYTLVFLLT